MSLRENKIEVEGRSMLLNILGILFNVVGVYFIAKGFHESAGASMWIYNTIGFSCFIIGIAALVALKGLFMFSFVARAFVGGLFIVSGLVKANDPWGFAFKLEEYFSPSGLAYDFPFFGVFEDYTLQISILVCIAEIVLGVAVIVGGKIKLTSWLLVLMMGFFTWLTFFTSSCVETAEMLKGLVAEGVELTPEQQGVLSRDCVTDCGCFGDALKGSVGRSLTPYESFWKDIVLFYFVIIIFINQWKIELNTYQQNWTMVPGALLVVIFFSWVFGWYFPIIFYVFALLGAFIFGNMNLGGLKKPWKMAIYVAIISFFFAMYTTLYLPVKDYRAYAVGNNITDEMNKGEAAIYDYVFIYKNKESGEDRRFAMDEYEEYGNGNWDFVDREPKLIKAGIDPPISDFVLTTDYENLTDEQKGHPLIDSILSESFEEYYQEQIVIESNFYRVDTIGIYDYIPYVFDTVLSPDTIFYSKLTEPFMGLIDQDSRFKVDLTGYVLSLDEVILMTVRDIEHVYSSGVEDVRTIYEQAVSTGIPFFILTPAADYQIVDFKSKFEFDAPVLSMDGTEIKIIVRSNPGLVLLKKGTVIDKWGSRSIPNFNDIIEKLK